MALSNIEKSERQRTEKSKLKWLAITFLCLLVVMCVFAFMATYTSGTLSVRFDGRQPVELDEPIDVSITSPLEENGGIPVNIQDQTTPPVDLFFLQAQGAPTNLTQPTQIDNRSITVTSTAGFSVGDYVGVFSDTGRFYFGELLTIGVNTLTMDTPLDFVFSAGDNVISTTRELNVDGDPNPETFIIQGAGAGTNVTVDITRIIIKMITDSVPDYSKFGDIAGGLTNGIVLRRMDGDTRNIFNVKTNGDFANLAYDLNVLQATNPGQGVNGLVVRLTFAGQDKHGVALRLEPQDELQLIIQDDLSSLTSFRIVAEGHLVQN